LASHLHLHRERGERGRERKRREERGRERKREEERGGGCLLYAVHMLAPICCA
jgi:hypothetical protein